MTRSQEQPSRLPIEQSVLIAVALALIAAESFAQDSQEPPPLPEPSA